MFQIILSIDILDRRTVYLLNEIDINLSGEAQASDE